MNFKESPGNVTGYLMFLFNECPYRVLCGLVSVAILSYAVFVETAPLSKVGRHQFDQGGGGALQGNERSATQVEPGALAIGSQAAEAFGRGLFEGAGKVAAASL